SSQYHSGFRTISKLCDENGKECTDCIMRYPGIDRATFKIIFCPLKQATPMSLVKLIYIVLAEKKPDKLP
ncbi:MAG: hypothetical protein ABI416_15180, partial [Ginsengibacter sp.]